MSTLTLDSHMTLATLGDLLDAAAGIVHEGQRVDQRQHALRCASFAHDDGADSALIVTALVHDLAKPLSVVRHGEVMAEVMTDRLPPLHVELLRVHGRYVADLNHGRKCAHNGPTDRLSELARRFALWDHRALVPGPHLDPDAFTPHLEAVLARR